MRIFSEATHAPKALAVPRLERPETAKHALLGLAAVRTIAALVALPLLPVLYKHDFLALVALRPSLGVLLLGAILARQGGMSLWAMLLIAVPLQLLIVWLYFLIGRVWESEIHSDDSLPFSPQGCFGAIRCAVFGKPCRRTDPASWCWPGSPSSRPVCWPQPPGHLS